MHSHVVSCVQYEEKGGDYVKEDGSKNEAKKGEPEPADKDAKAAKKGAKVGLSRSTALLALMRIGLYRAEMLIAGHLMGTCVEPIVHVAAACCQTGGPGCCQLWGAPMINWACATCPYALLSSITHTSHAQGKSAATSALCLLAG